VELDLKTDGKAVLENPFGEAGRFEFFCNGGQKHGEPLGKAVGGDGIGQEVIPVASEMIRRLHPEYEFFPVEVGYGRWKRTGEAMGAD
jgi:hypothetical protein